MLFTCVQDCYDNGTLDNLDRWGHPIRFGHRRGTVYNLKPADILRLMDHLTGVDDTAAKGYPDGKGTPTLDPQYIPVIGFLECFRTGEDLAVEWMDKHNDQLCDIVDAKVEQLRKHPVPMGTIDPTRMTLRRKGKSAAETLADGKTTSTSDIVETGEKTVLRPRAQTSKPTGRKPMSAEARAAAGARLKAAREKKAAQITAKA
jgi:hypothetical protein